MWCTFSCVSLTVTNHEVLEEKLWMTTVTWSEINFSPFERLFDFSFGIFVDFLVSSSFLQYDPTTVDCSVHFSTLYSLNSWSRLRFCSSWVFIKCGSSVQASHIYPQNNGKVAWEMHLTSHTRCMTIEWGYSIYRHSPTCSCITGILRHNGRVNNGWKFIAVHITVNYR